MTNRLLQQSQGQAGTGNPGGQRTAGPAGRARSGGPASAPSCSFPHNHLHTEPSPGSHTRAHTRSHSPQLTPAFTHVVTSSVSHTHTVHSPTNIPGMSHQHLHTVTPTHQYTPAAFTCTPTPTLRHSPGLGPTQTGERGASHPHFAPAGLPPLHPPNREGNQPGSEAMLDRRGAGRGGEMEGKEDSVKHSVSQTRRAVGGTGCCPWWGESPFVPCKMWRATGPGPLEAEK